MKLNLKASKTLFITMLLILSMVVYRFFMDVSYWVYTPLFFGTIAVGSFMVIYHQKTGRPICKECKQKMELKNKKLLSQDEEIRYGQFVFIYKYEYEYQCEHCKEVVHINKTVKK